MKLTDVHSYWRLTDLINKVAEEYLNPLTIIKVYYWAKVKSYREPLLDALKYSMDECLYILKGIIGRLQE